jgi:hypothetical protein
MKENQVMKRFGLAAALLAALALIALAAVPPSNFGGAWALDKSKSQGLPPRMQDADVTWVITQTDNQITIKQKVSGGQMSGQNTGGGPGAGSGRGAGMGGPRTYQLDGSESTVEGGGPMGGKSTLKAGWSSDGNTLELSSKSVRNFQGNEVTITSTDKLQLSADGKVLTVTRHSESPRGTQDLTLVFNKQ